jgi:hypothetical protein
MSTIAVFLALGGGAYALTLPKNSVGSRQLKKGAVIRSKIHSNAITSRKVKDFSLLSRDFRRGQLPGLVGVRAADTDPLGPPSTVIKEAHITTRLQGKLYVLATLRDPYLNCAEAPCSAVWGIYVDNQPIPDGGLRLEAAAGEGDGHPYDVLYGITPADVPPGSHTIRLARSTSGNIAGVGELAMQLGVLALGR